MFALLALGAFQWLSSRIAPPPAADDGSLDHHAPGDGNGDTTSGPAPCASVNKG